MKSITKPVVVVRGQGNFDHLIYVTGKTMGLLLNQQPRKEVK